MNYLYSLVCQQKFSWLHFQSAQKYSPHKMTRSAMTLVEMLVATALTLIMMALVAQLFGMLGKGVNGSRNRVELYSQMQATGQRLRQDLAGITVDLKPPAAPEDGAGYFEYIEGKETDSLSWGANGLGSYELGAAFAKSNLSSPASPDAALSAYITALGSDDRLVGDVDDVILFTTRSSDAPFSGKLDNGIIESPVTEVVWFCQVVPNTFNPRRYSLYRRQRIVMGNPAKNVGTFSVGQVNALDVSNGADLLSKWQLLENVTDISCRLEGNYAVPNTLGDLTKRQNRFCHSSDAPYVFDPNSGHLRFTSASGRYGEDLILTNCIGFDVKVFDDSGGSSAKSVGTSLVSPSDPGFSGVSSVVSVLSTTSANSSLPIYTDLGSGGQPTSGFLYSPDSNPMIWPTYDTWSTTYSYDSIPYAQKVRGLEVRIRCYEPASRTVLQLTVRESFD